MLPVYLGGATSSCTTSLSLSLTLSLSLSHSLSYSRTSVADDHVEEHKLLGQDSERVRLFSFGGLGSDEVNGEACGSSEEIIVHLRECIKTERDQKVST